MKGDKEVIRALNSVLGQSLIAINQYFLHARIVKNWGVEELNDAFYKQSIQEMKWSDELIERILLLEGLPNLQELGKLLIGENVEEILACDLRLEKRKHDVLVDAIGVCTEKRDFVSRELLIRLKDGNEEYEDWLETQQEKIEDIGIQNYIQIQSAED
ncbi:bacterioferritin [Moraxella bovoculi]|uniref:Bacterioferritin n=1 Tax=Moraxella bovoculi TaxID=386891 RepID=A0AAC8PVH8_9GAMM|nr:bacterioferritin [Moraxella bovoculi]AKG07748.1 bacterioferritin [Moraxella bovoculi]AKG09654.1 bacterioferritin [Moraxella bovoculi]AKG11571.1 bacterioferritin [Moraxella bovoculi]AKG13536.1 bacterioferritin [Moraxella bovoculi]